MEGDEFLKFDLKIATELETIQVIDQQVVHCQYIIL